MTTYTFEHEGVINMLQLGVAYESHPPLDVDVRVVNTSNTTQVSIELFANMVEFLTVAVDTSNEYDGTKLGIDFGVNRLCNTGFKGTITVPAPLQHLRFLSQGRATVDKIDCVNEEKQPVYDEFGFFPPRIEAKSGGSFSIGEVVCALPNQVRFDARNDGQLNISQVHVRRARFVNSDSRGTDYWPNDALRVTAGQVTESASVYSSYGGVIDLGSVTSPSSDISLTGPGAAAITGLVSENLYVNINALSTPEEPLGTIYTTVTRELRADCGAGAWNETAFTVLGNFTRTGSCFDEPDTDTFFA